MIRLYILATVIALAAMGQSLGASEKKTEPPEHPLLICVKEFVAPAVQDNAPPSFSKDARRLLVTRSSLPAVPRGGADGKPGLSGWSAYRVIDTSGDMVPWTMSEGRSASEFLMPFSAGELVSAEIFGSRDDKAKGSPVIMVRSKYPHSVTRGRGSFEHESHEPIQLMITVSNGVACDTLKATLEKLFRPAVASEVADWERNHSEITNGAIVPTLREGMTVAEVSAILGTPDRIASVAGKTIYFYQKMKVTFTAGVVTGIE